MKKFLALALAVAMVLSLASVSFAADYGFLDTQSSDVEAGEDNCLGLVGPTRYDGDAKLMKTDRGFKYGDTVYYMLLDEYDSAIAKYEAVEKLKVKASFEMGGDLVESVSIVKKYVQTGTAAHTAPYQVFTTAYGEGTDKPGYYYFVALKLANKETTSDADVVGTLTFDRKSNDDLDLVDGIDKFEGKIDDLEYDVSFNVFYGDYDWNRSGKDYNVQDGDEVVIDYDEAYALKFDCDDEVELLFGMPGDAENEGSFTVDVSGQGKVYLKFNTNADEAIVAANPGVKMQFVNFNGVKFNRTGEYAYELEDGVAAYKVVDGQLVEIPGCVYDDADETFYFQTRVLENYVFATAELVNPAPAVEEAPVVEAPEVTNPSTGAAL